MSKYYILPLLIHYYIIISIPLNFLISFDYFRTINTTLIE